MCCRSRTGREPLSEQPRGGERLGAAPNGRPRAGGGPAAAPPPWGRRAAAVSRERPLRRSRAEPSAGGRSHGVGGGGADAAAAARGRLRPARGLRPQRAAQDPAGVPAAGAVSGGASGGRGGRRGWAAAAAGGLQPAVLGSPQADKCRYLAAGIPKSPRGMRGPASGRLRSKHASRRLVLSCVQPVVRFVFSTNFRVCAGAISRGRSVSNHLLQWRKKCSATTLFCRIEAARCPDVVVAQIDPKKLRKKQTVNISVSLGCSTPFALF